MLLSTLARSSVKPCRGSRSTYATISGQQFPFGSSFRPSSHPPGQSDGASPKPRPSLSSLLEQQSEFSGKVIPASLQSEPTPSQTRRCDLAAPAHERGLVLIAHALADAEDDNVRTITLSTGFVLEAKQKGGESLILGCLHTLNEVYVRSEEPILFIHLPDSAPAPSRLHPQALARPLFGQYMALPPPFPSPTSPSSVHTQVHPSLLHDSPGPSTVTPFLPGLRSSSVQGNLSIYNDAHGREASPGTYDTLAQMMFTPPPTPGASGGPLIDEAGTVVGVVLGSRWEGGPKGRTVGLGVPAEAIFEMFELFPRKA